MAKPPSQADFLPSHDAPCHRYLETPRTAMYCVLFPQLCLDHRCQRDNIHLADHDLQIHALQPGYFYLLRILSCEQGTDSLSNRRFLLLLPHSRIRHWCSPRPLASRSCGRLLRTPTLRPHRARSPPNHHLARFSHNGRINPRARLCHPKYLPLHGHRSLLRRSGHGHNDRDSRIKRLPSRRIS